MLAQVYLSLGSNIDRDHYIRAALDALAEQFGELKISSVYESESVGFVGDNFFNLVVGLSTELSVGELSGYLKALEYRHGRQPDCARFSSRTLDIDILTYADLTGRVDGVTLPRGEILENAFVLWPLAELAPDARHPLLGTCYETLWRNYSDRYDRRGQSLWPVSFCWRGSELSRLMNSGAGAS
ncbi:2-amino-4-hydroxy-6-hydroxymethyldihydropteridine diphosphokinase [uncultured Porticoccus sp.]|uniref:2-amino-4-hydroxy-6- hydroxymethyldihydropteridine diphosphokinase n=1 Tax=uncultured Porticoccus sp. TaxID=1256050 RepID=UPI0034283229